MNTLEKSLASPACPRPDTQPNVHETILRWFPTHSVGRVLDAGAGEGSLSLALARRGYQVVACDWNPARFQPREIPFVQCSLEAALPFGRATFDAVISTEVLEHLENPHHLVKEFARILRPGGTLVVTTPNILNVYSRIHFLLLGTCDFFDTLSGSRETAFHGTKGHINPVGFPELRYALERAGLRVTEVTTNRDVSIAICDGSLKMALASLLLFPVAIAARMVTMIVRRSDRVSLQLLNHPLLYGEDLIVVAQCVEQRVAEDG